MEKTGRDARKLIILFFTTVLTLKGATARVVTLREAYDAAVKQSEKLQIDFKRVDQADARIDQAWGRVLPQVSAGANYQRLDSNGSRDANRNYQSYARFTVTQSLYEGGREWIGLDIVKDQKRALELDASSTQNHLYVDVAKTYYEILSLEEELESLKTTLDLTEKRAKELKRRSDIGRSRVSEVLSAQSQADVLGSQIELVRGELKVQRNRLALLTGLEAQIELKSPNAPPAPHELSYYLEKAKTRPELASLAIAKSVAQKSTELAKAGHMPSLQLTGNSYIHRSGAQRDVDWDVGVGLTIPLFSGGTTQAEVREAKEREVESELLLLQKRRQIETEVRTSYDNLITAFEQIRKLQKALASAERNYHEQSKDYQYSLVTNLDVLQALNSFHETKRSLNRARYQALLSWAELMAATAEIP